MPKENILHHVGDIKSLSDKKRLKEFLTSRLTLWEKIRKFFRQKENDRSLVISRGKWGKFLRDVPLCIYSRAVLSPSEEEQMSIHCKPCKLAYPWLLYRIIPQLSVISRINMTKITKWLYSFQEVEEYMLKR